MKITVDTFGGMYPSVPDDRLKEGMAVFAMDLDL